MFGEVSWLLAVFGRPHDFSGVLGLRGRDDLFYVFPNDPTLTRSCLVVRTLDQYVFCPSLSSFYHFFCFFGLEGFPLLSLLGLLDRRSFSFSSSWIIVQCAGVKV